MSVPRHTRTAVAIWGLLLAFAVIQGAATLLMPRKKPEQEALRAEAAEAVA